MHLRSRQHYLDIIVGDIKGDIGATWVGARRGRLGVEEEEKSHTVFIFLCIYCADRLFCVPQTSNRHGGGEPLDRSDRPKGGRRRVNLILVSRTWGGAPSDTARPAREKE